MKREFTRTLLMLLGAVCFIALPFIPSAFGQSTLPITGGSSTGTATALVGSASLDNGSAAAPSLNFTNSTTTGFYRAAADSPGVSIAGVRSFRFDPGTVGVLFGATDLPFLRLDGVVGARMGYSTSTAITLTNTNIQLTVGGGGEIFSNQGLRLNSGSIARPTCAAGIRGTLWYTPSAGGVADTMEVCAKAAADTYAWRSMATIP